MVHSKPDEYDWNGDGVRELLLRFSETTTREEFLATVSAARSPNGLGISRQEASNRGILRQKS